jgi:hypothetical protein
VRFWSAASIAALAIFSLGFSVAACGDYRGFGFPSCGGSNENRAVQAARGCAEGQKKESQSGDAGRTPKPPRATASLLNPELPIRKSLAAQSEKVAIFRGPFGLGR